MNTKLLTIINSLLILICLIALSGGLVYRFYSLNKIGIIISLTLALISFIIIQYFRLLANKKTRRQNKPNLNQREKQAAISIRIFCAAGYGLLLLACFYLLLSHRADRAIVSPWQVVPKYFFIVYGLATLFLIANAIINKKLVLPLIMFHYFLSFSVALIIYKLGYGYDPFIHQATENLIAQTGAVQPKPFYYLGQYALVVIFHKITAVPLVWLDRLLVPLLAALFLPIILWRALNSWLDSERLNLILIIALLILSFPIFILTTPQNLAYLFLLLAIILGLSCENFYDFSIILLLAAAASVIQPVAGIPALLFGGALAVYHSDGPRLKYFYPLLLLLAVTLLPTLFYLLNNRLPFSAIARASALEPVTPNFSLPGTENFILNFAYLYGFNIKYILTILALSGVFIAYKHREQCKILFIYLALAASLLASYLLTVKLPFAFLINYERDDYPQRILLVAGLFLLPFIILALYSLIEKVSQQNIFIKSSFAVFLTLLIGASLYISYPRYDNYFNSRGYSVSTADNRAVNWINADAKSDFIVLANQQVSAAALSQFGFKKYFSGRNGEQIFYYPIPTGSPLYQYYLDMVYKKPSRETMFRALDLTGVSQGYFVLNKYWWAFPKILDEAKFRADSWQEINNGEVFVFKYERK